MPDGMPKACAAWSRNQHQDAGLITECAGGIRVPS